jgi:hypothetical protein
LSIVISAALRARRTANDLKHGVDSISQHAQGEIAELQQLAQKADDLGRFCRGPKKWDLASLMSPQVRLGPLIAQHGLMQLRQLADLHDREARLFRQFAAKEVDRDRVRRSRYRVSREKEVRDRIAFMHLMAADLREVCGKPHYDAVAAITNIAFPGANVTSEHVRASCRPTTRQGRRRKPFTAPGFGGWFRDQCNKAGEIAAITCLSANSMDCARPLLVGWRSMAARRTPATQP